VAIRLCLDWGFRTDGPFMLLFIVVTVLFDVHTLRSIEDF